MNFPTSIQEIEKRIAAIEPERYTATRNYVDGAVTYLSPYISRGVISTNYVFEKLCDTGLPFERMEKLIQELAWRDYWQQVWIAKGSGINEDIKRKQAPVSSAELSVAIAHHQTGIDAIDTAIASLYETGYMHNHVRMYVASIACNIAQTHWLQPAQWMYYYLLDCDWASNALSWQWVAGANANKKYYANQENINKYCHDAQSGTFLDTNYEALAATPVPDKLQERTALKLKTVLPQTDRPQLDAAKKTLVYNYYNLDPNWHKGENVNRVLLLEPAFFEQFPVSEKCIHFVLALAENIPDMQVVVASFDSLFETVPADSIIYKEHPTNEHYSGQQEPREWMCDVIGYYPSFFAFWKKCRKALLQRMVG